MSTTRTGSTRMRPPRSAYACRVFYGLDGKKSDDLLQVVSANGESTVICAWTHQETVVYGSIWVHWLSGSARELAETLCAERRREADAVAMRLAA